MYHRVVDNDCNFISSNIYNQAGTTISTATFIKQIKLLQKQYSIISLRELVSRLQESRILPLNVCALTFDDGYKDHYQNVFPILKKLEIPATFFVIGACIAGSGRVRWLDKYYYILDHALLKYHDIELENILSYIYYKFNKKDENKFTPNLLKNFIRGSLNKDKIINYLARILQVKIDSKKINQSLYLSRDNILEMMNYGMDFGAHSMTHPDLSKLNFRQAQYEIMQSGDIIREITRQRKIAFAYPFGGPKTYNKKIMKILRSNNFLCACTSIPELNTRSTPLFELRRIGGEKFIN